MATSSLPPGFRFHPTDVELVLYYLKRKIMGKPLQPEIISEIDLYKYPPWDLPGNVCLESKDLEWYFFCCQDRKYAGGNRTNRSTVSGCWKISGKDKHITHHSRIIGHKKTLVFYKGRSCREGRTDWVMHEFRLQNEEFVNAGFSPMQKTYVVCKIFKKSGIGSKIGEHHGAPYKEEEWGNTVINEGESSNLYLPCQLRPLNISVSSSGTIHQQSVVSELGELQPKQDLVDTNAFVDQMIEDHHASMLPKNADQEPSSMILPKSNSEVVDIHTQNAIEQNPIDQREQLKTCLEELLKCFDEQVPLNEYCSSDNMDKELPMLTKPAIAQVPVIQDLEDSDHAEILGPKELLPSDSFVNFSSFESEIPSFASDEAFNMDWNFLPNAPDLFYDQSIMIPEAIGPSDVDHQRKSLLCSSNFRGCENAQNVYGGVASDVASETDVWNDLPPLDSNF